MMMMAMGFVIPSNSIDVRTQKRVTTHPSILRRMEAVFMGLSFITVTVIV